MYRYFNSSFLMSLLASALLMSSNGAFASDNGGIGNLYVTLPNNLSASSSVLQTHGCKAHQQQSGWFPTLTQTLVNSCTYNSTVLKGTITWETQLVLFKKCALYITTSCGHNFGTLSMQNCIVEKVTIKNIGSATCPVQYDTYTHTGDESENVYVSFTAVSS